MGISPTERSFIRAAEEDEGYALMYSDWLEEQGREDEAAFIRGLIWGDVVTGEPTYPYRRAYGDGYGDGYGNESGNGFGNGYRDEYGDGGSYGYGYGYGDTDVSSYRTGEPI